MRPISLILLASGLALLNPNAFAAEGRTPVRSLLEIRREGVIVQKWETSCAAAALATVLTFLSQRSGLGKTRRPADAAEH